MRKIDLARSVNEGRWNDQNEYDSELSGSLCPKTDWTCAELGHGFGANKGSGVDCIRWLKR